MTKRGSAKGLGGLLGTTVVFQGRFPYGVREQLEAMVEAQQGRVVNDLDAAVGYLVLPDLAGGKGVQKKASSLNAKGASVQVLDADGFRKLVEPTDEQLLELIRGGSSNADLLKKAMGGDAHVFVQTVFAGSTALTLARGGRARVITDARFAGLDLSGLDLSAVTFERCDFSASTLEGTQFGPTSSCDFGTSVGAGPHFASLQAARFPGARLSGARLAGSFAGGDFSASSFEGATFSQGSHGLGGRAKPQPEAGCVFADARLRSARFTVLELKAPVFDRADCAGAVFASCAMEAPSFRGANLQGASFVGCRLPAADFSGANLSGANLAEAALTGARFDGADLAGCGLAGATLDGVNLARARNYDPSAVSVGAVGPALTELDAVAAKAQRVQVAFFVRTGQDDDGEAVGVDTANLQYGWGVRLPQSVSSRFGHFQKVMTLSSALLRLAALLGQSRVRYETLDVSSTKSPTSGKELRDLVLRGLAEAFAQPAPAADELAKATKAYRQQVREQGSAQREEREKLKKAEAKRQETAKRQISKKVARQVGKVTDLATFLKALELRVEAPKIQKATSMLKAERFKLFNDVTDEHVSGVVKSQTDPDLVYACHIDRDGHYACCTQNLNVCGGLRGSICKHLLVLIVGLVKAGELDPSTIDAWISKTHLLKAELDKERMGEVFIKYKGAEAGEVDWRPTETVPEDYYAL